MSYKFIPPEKPIVSIRFSGPLQKVQNELAFRNTIQGFKLGNVDHEIKYGVPFVDAVTDEIKGELTFIIKLLLYMPVWDAPAKTPASHKAEWIRFKKALRAHEDGHITMFERECKVMYIKMSSAKTGKELDEFYKNEEKRILDMRDEYEMRTDHGKKQDSPYGNVILNVP